jgi:hypothetical protein
MPLKVECANCQSDEFWLASEGGKWLAVCEYCEDEYELLPGGTIQLLRHGQLD